MDRVEIFDSTLRDGAQAEGISFSVADKVNIARALDELGVAYIEAGNPFSNRKDAEFFERLKGEPFVNAKLVAFGSTRRRGVTAEEDANVRALIESGAGTVAVFGKAWDFHVTDIIGAALDENLEMIRDTVGCLRRHGIDVIFDAEHFFDGYKANPEYAIAVLKAAEAAGARCLVLCDTNGGALPMAVFDVTKAAVAAVQATVGIHCHNDCGFAVANAAMAVSAGARHVQGTYTGFGERCGNTALCAAIPNLQLKMGFECIPPENVALITQTARRIAEVANVHLGGREPFVGRTAFAHKGGMHIDGVRKNPKSFEHMDPEAVGNARRVLTSEVAGRGAVLANIQRVRPGLTKDAPEVGRIVQKIKEAEQRGYQFEAAEASVDLLIRKELNAYEEAFTLDYFKIISQRPAPHDVTTALIKVSVGGKPAFAAAEGDGPVNALDKALREALTAFYGAELAMVRLTDYKVRVLDGGDATAAKVRVLIESTDGAEQWTTVGVSTDIIQASWKALRDSIEYKLLKG